MIWPPPCCSARATQHNTHILSSRGCRNPLGPAYRSSRAVRRAHNIPLRFGKTRNITAVVAGDEPSDEYFKGVFISAIILFVIFLLWMIVLLALKFCRRAGVFSGTPLTVLSSTSATTTSPLDTVQAEGQETQQEHENEPKPEETIESMDQDGNGKTVEVDMGPTVVVNDTKDVKDVVVHDVKEAPHVRAYQSTLCIRFTALLGACGVMVGSILMITKGIVNVEDAANSGGDGLIEGARLATGGADLIKQYADLQEPLMEQLETTIQGLNEFCPLVRSAICEVDPVTMEVTDNCDFSDIPYGDLLEEIGLSSVDASVFFEELDKTEEDLRDLAADLLEQEEAIEDVEWPFKVARAFAFILLFLALGLLTCLVHAWRQDYLKTYEQEKITAVHRSNRRRRKTLLCLKNWVLMSSFILFVVLALVFSTVFIALSTTTSDFCVDGPDDTILVFLEENEERIDTLVYRFSAYYVSRCPPGKLPEDFDIKVEEVETAFADIARFLDAVRESSDEVSATCGSDPLPLVTAADVLLTQLCIVRDLIFDVMIYFSCENCKEISRGRSSLLSVSVRTHLVFSINSCRVSPLRDSCPQDGL